MFGIGKPLQPNIMEHSGLFGRVVSYKENVVLGILSQGLHSQKLILFISYKWPNKQKCLSPPSQGVGGKVQALKVKLLNCLMKIGAYVS